MRTDELYGRLAAPFDVIFHDTRGGTTFDYVTGEQVTTRLNAELGFMNWSFRVLEHGIHAEADECWVLAELSVTGNEGRTTVVRQQFGSQKVKRSRATGVPLDIGFDLKGAATDALKKCASLVGVGLYLYEKEAVGAGKAVPAKRPPAAPKQAQQQPTPIKPQATAQPTRGDLLAAYRKVVQAAIDLGHPQSDSLIANKPEGMDDVKLATIGGRLQQWVINKRKAG